METTIRILVVDDAAVADSVERADDRFDVTTEPDERAALDRLETESFDCVVSDYAESGADGIELLRAVRGQRPMLPVILFTGEGSEAVASEAFTAGATDYVRKGIPDQYGVLSTRIERAVSGRQRTERELERSRAEYRELFEGIPEAVFLRQRGEAFCAVNETAVTRLGYTRTELLSLRPSDIDPNLSADAEPERIETLDFDTVRRFDTTHMTKDGEEFPVEVSATRVPYRGETAILSTARDVSERVARERDLRRQNERLEELASVVSHDLRNPLNVAAGRIDLETQQRDSRHLDVAANALKRMERLIDDLLALASGNDIDRRPLNLERLVDKCWATVATGDARLECDAGRTVRADESRLAQVFENLFRNCIEHGATERGTQSGDSVDHPAMDPPVTISVGLLDDGFYVADDGPGIAPADRDRIFESGYSTDENGTGLGLTIVRDVIETHGWQLSIVESESGGARFEISGVE